MPYADPELEHTSRSLQPTQQGFVPWPEDGQAGQFPAYSPGYGPHASGGGDSVRRPGSVTAAAVLAFIIGGLGSLGYLVVLASVAAASANWTTPVLVVLGAVLLVGLSLSVMTVWGGVSAMRGRGRKLLETAAWITLTLSLLGLVGYLISSDVSGAVSTVVQMVPVMAIVALLQRPSSIEFFHARRSRAS
jgi:VIT1/CCC1 family predicted Fe2+/Mn2+ transporter